MNDTRCRYCLAYFAACQSLLLFAGRACCPECGHDESLPTEVAA